MGEFIVMPDHIHGIIVIHEKDRSVQTVGARSPRPVSSDNTSSIARSPRPVSSENTSSIARLPRPWSPRPDSPEKETLRAGLPRPYESKQPFSDSTQRAPTLGQIVAFYKYQSTKCVNQIRGTPGAPVWQRNYYEHIIRDLNDLSRIREYIRTNPLRRETDY